MANQNNHDATLPFPILIGDIGGTNARFALLVDAYAQPKFFPNVHTADFPTMNEAIQATVLDKTSVQPRSAILAIAGPIQGDEIPLTNCPWVVKPKEMISDLGFSDVLVINDFEAQALAIASLGENDREQIGGGASLPRPRVPFSARAPVSALPASSMPSMPGSRFRARAAISMSARAAIAIISSSRITTRSKAASPPSSFSAVVVSSTSITQSARSTASSRS